jgi:hypothetical protein
MDSMESLPCIILFQSIIHLFPEVFSSAHNPLKLSIIVESILILINIDKVPLVLFPSALSLRRPLSSWSLIQLFFKEFILLISGRLSSLQGAWNPVIRECLANYESVLVSLTQLVGYLFVMNKRVF